MSQAKDTRIAIIGFGFLMSYLHPCYTQFFSSEEEQHSHITAVTADQASLEEKRRRYAFPILLNDNRKVLEELSPHVILFAPPPSVAPELARTVLKPYYDRCRTAGEPLPMLFAFPPSPQGEFYLELLGEDVSVCNILPNMTREIGGQPLRGAEGNTYITIPEKSPWPPERRQFLEQFFGMLGQILYIPTKNIRDLLASLCVAEVIPPILFDIADALAERGLPVTPAQLASSMRAAHQADTGFSPRGSAPCDANAVDGALQEELAAFCRSWRGGAEDFLVSSGIEAAEAQKIMASNCDLRLHIVQCEARDRIEADLRAHATPGGVAERGRTLYALLASQRIRAWFGPGREETPESFLRWVRTVSCEIAAAVARHARRLAGEALPERFTPTHHAVLYGLLVRRAKALAGEAGTQAIHRATLLYAAQRGRRMALRAEADGAPLTPLSYMAYSEWSPEPGTMEAEDVCFQPEVVTRAYVCPWLTAWERLGFLEEGKEYCGCIDYHLVKGFSKDLTLQVPKTRTEGGDCCEFVWENFSMDEAARATLAQKKAALGDRCKKDWLYHTRHLLSAMDRELRPLPEGPDILERALEDFSALYGAEAREAAEGFAGINFDEAYI